MSTAATVADRASKYGSFTVNAGVVQQLKNAMKASPNWVKLASDQKESLELIATKIGRMLSGNPDLLDNWHDIGGYALLVEQRLASESGKARVKQA